MGTSSSGSGPKGRTPLLPNWATSGGDNSNQEDDQNSDATSTDNKETEDTNRQVNDYSDPLTTVKGAIRRVVNGKSGASFKKAAKNYIKKSGGFKSATHASKAGINTGSNYLGFFSGVGNTGLNQTLKDHDLSDCIGKSTEEVFARIADKIAPDGSTNDEAIARAAVTMALDKLYQRLIDNDQDISTLDQLDEETLKDTVIEFVGAYIFKKFVYEFGQALERNELTEAEAVEREEEMRIFIKDEVRSALTEKEISTLDIGQGEGKKVIEDIFDLVYSTLEK